MREYEFTESEGRYDKAEGEGNDDQDRAVDISHNRDEAGEKGQYTGDIGEDTWNGKP